MKDYFYGFDYNTFFGKSVSQKLDSFLKEANYALSFEEDSKPFIKEAMIQ